ncbi:MAG TPA: transcription antitermination factor NusB [Gallionellaceae bacterium]|nr:transcription antitermination factor NusB [Gallionellaceae bacterium]
MSEPSEQKPAKSPAKSARHRARELALQAIYQWRMSGGDHLDIEKTTRAEKSLGRFDVELYSQLLRGVVEHNQALVAALAPHLDRDMNELSPIEFSVLLLGAFELTSHPEVPYRVVINESVELAKTFGGTDGHKFVNGVLDKLAAQVRAVEVNAK